jgi:hypothetical protein
MRPAAGWNAYRTAGIASGLIAVVLVGVLAASQVGGHTGTARVSLSPTLGDVTPTWFSSDAFTCTTSAAFGRGPAPQLAHVQAVGAFTRARYDRIAIQFADGQPAQSDIQIREGSGFTEVPGGRAAVLKGEYGALVTLHATDGHGSFGGPPDVKTTYPVVLELRQVQDFQGTVQWAVGLAHAACYRVGFVSHPAGLVIDFQLRGPV